MTNQYSEGLTKKLLARYKKQMPDLDDEQILFYINRFGQIKKSPKLVNYAPEEFTKDDSLSYLDITKYKDFAILERTVDQFPTKVKMDEIDEDNDPNELYNENNLEIYRAPNQVSCARYAHTKGGSYGWCISRKDASSMYSNYRFGSGSRMFYFVYDRDRPNSGNNTGGYGGNYVDPYHVIVVHVFEKGDYGFSTANNSGDSTGHTWDEMMRELPKGLADKLRDKEDLFEYIKPTQEEIELHALQNKSLTLDQFIDLSYRVKLAYINAGNKLTDEQFDAVSDDIKNQYINNGNKVKPKLIEGNKHLEHRYAVMRIRNNDPIPQQFFKSMKEEELDVYYHWLMDSSEEDNNEEYIAFKFIKEFFPNKLGEYLETSLKNFSYMEQEAIDMLTPEQLSLYNKYSLIFNDNLVINQYNDNDGVEINYVVNTGDFDDNQYNSLSENDRSTLRSFVNQMKEENSEQSLFWLTLINKDLLNSM